MFNIIENIKNRKRLQKGIDDFVLLRIDGGLGSVILQYALGLNIQKHTGKNIKYDATWFDNNCMDCDNKFSREFTFKKLFPDVEFNLATKEEIEFYTKNYLYKNKLTWKYNEYLFNNKKPKYFSGYYSHYRYWVDDENALQRNLDFSKWVLNEENLKMKKEIENSEYSVAIHIRRGDFVNLGWCCLTDDYYINGINYIKEHMDAKLKLFFFSNDYAYVENNILPKIGDIDYKLVDINDNDTGYYDMYLMSLCKSQIIANSTFSICSALLNKNLDKIVIAPNTWGYNIGKNRQKNYVGIEDSIQNPAWVCLNYSTGEVVNKKGV